MPRSAELGQGLGLVASVALLGVVVPRLGRALADTWTATASAAALGDPSVATAAVGRFFAAAALAVAPLVVGVGALSVGGQLLLVGGRPNPWQLRPRWEKLNPLKGIRGLFSRQQLWELTRTAVKLAAVAGLSWGVWVGAIRELVSGPRPLSAFVGVIADGLRSLGLRMALFALVLALVDAGVARRRHMRSLRMTRREVRDEHRQSEGDPQVRAAIRARQRRLTRSRMIAEVAKATVVVTNPTHLAVALRYEAGMAAPVVVAKGAGAVARRIREEAARHGIPVRENKPVARALFRAVEVGEAIPAELYRAVAEILAALWRAGRIRTGVLR